MLHYLIMAYTVINCQNSDKKKSIKQLKDLLQTTSNIVIGAGAGLSTSAGYTYDGPRFDHYFSDFGAAYGIQDMYSGGFYHFKTPEEKWAFMSRVIYVNRFLDTPNQVYTDLLRLVQDKDYFVITTNVDHSFQKAGFDKNRLYYTQGDYGSFQCSVPCIQKTWDNEEIITRMFNEQTNMKIPKELLPKCPNCGKPLTTHLRVDDKFVEDEGWHRAANNYKAFLKSHENQPIIYLELGVGFNTPGIIKFPFWQKTYSNPNATFVTINYGEAYTTDEIRNKSICIGDDIGTVIKELLE